MSFLDIAKKRYSVRAYKKDPVPENLLGQVLEAGILAPSACNRQPLRIIVIRTAGRERELGRVYPNEWFCRAPIVLAVVGLAGEGWKRRDGRSYNDVDCAIVMDHMILAATELGLGTCWIGAFDPAAAREVLGLPAGVEPVAFTPLGFPADPPGKKTRRPLEELVKKERWS